MKNWPVSVCLFLFSFCFQLSAVNSATAGIENIKPIGQKLHIVLIPGSGASNGIMDLGKVTQVAHLTGHKYYFKEYAKLLTQMEIPFSYCLLMDDQDARKLVDRAEECVENILKTAKKEKLKDKTVLLLGHSMGGNIARLVAADKRLENLVHSVLSISTPHYGTILGDYVFEQYYSGEDFETPFYRWIIDTLDFAPTRRNYIKELTVGRWMHPSTYRPQDVEKVESINYYSISNYMRGLPNSLFFMTWSILDTLLEERGLDQSFYGKLNDGIIPTYSMVFGEHLGTVQADHAEGLCIGTFKVTPGCFRMMNLLIPTLNKFRD